MGRPDRWTEAVVKIAPFRVIFFVAVGFFAFRANGWAQSPGPNVNIMNPPTDGSFVGDIFERQVETDIAPSPVNSGRAMAGFITYQTLEPGASAWRGYSETTNGGKTWSSNLVPGFPQDTSSHGRGSPFTLGLQPCSNTVLRACRTTLEGDLSARSATDPVAVFAAEERFR